ncbi:hypothetical protein ETAA8_07900 [Anatilimnocola aggregata]|uniref:Uncharacterized protein n=1 Tax=Anatilimnocola aggregata TaxID=2528021 RepID=A0A517Y676_9BACT|nr:hypothetical protein ETAA8_07900 [Anatilimnocola aggregata]
MSTTRSAAPNFAAVLLMLPMLYAGSYLALVRPVDDVHGCFYQYPRIGTDYGRMIIWPLQRIDIKVRPVECVYERMDEREWNGQWNKPALP